MRTKSFPAWLLAAYFLAPILSGLLLAKTGIAEFLDPVSTKIGLLEFLMRGGAFRNEKAIFGVACFLAIPFAWAYMSRVTKLKSDVANDKLALLALGTTLLAIILIALLWVGPNADAEETPSRLIRLLIAMRGGIVGSYVLYAGLIFTLTANIFFSFKIMQFIINSKGLKR